MIDKTGLSFTLTDGDGLSHWMGGEDFGIHVTGRNDPGWAGLKRTVVDVPGIHGSVAEGGYIQGNQWIVPCVLEGTDHDDALIKLENLAWLLNRPENLRITFDSRPGVFWYVDTSEKMELAWAPGSNRARFDLTFGLLDPVGYASSETRLAVAIPSEPHGFSVAAANLSLGGVATYPQWIFQPSEDIAGVIVTNTTTGEYCNVSHSLPAGQYIRLDAATQEIHTSGMGITWTRHNEGGSGIIPRLMPRKQNNLTVSGVVGNLEIVYRERFGAAAR